MKETGLRPISQVMHFVDANTRKLLAKASGSEEINEILKKPTVIWQNKALCLRHPFNAGGCPLPTGADLDSWPSAFKVFPQTMRGVNGLKK